MENLDFAALVAIALPIPVLVIALWIRQGIRKRKLNAALGIEMPVFGTAVDREAAERDLRGSALELRERWLEKHRLYDRYSTFHGFTETYMNDLIKALLDEGISAGVIFQQTLPPGVSDMIYAAGIYELYVEREQFTRADEFIRARMKT